MLTNFELPKFYVMSHFVQYIGDYCSVVNHNIAYNMTIHKYFFKNFNNKINKKKYNLQIFQHNVHYTNKIIIKDVIILEKTKEKKKLLEDIADITMSAKVT